MRKSVWIVTVETPKSDYYWETFLFASVKAYAETLDTPETNDSWFEIFDSVKAANRYAEVLQENGFKTFVNRREILCLDELDELFNQMGVEF